jgi:hypothetical protein
MREEIEQVQKIWEAPMVVFFTYGEYGGSKTGKYTYHHNTCCLVALKERILFITIPKPGTGRMTKE